MSLMLNPWRLIKETFVAWGTLCTVIPITCALHLVLGATVHVSPHLQITLSFGMMLLLLGIVHTQPLGLWLMTKVRMPKNLALQEISSEDATFEVAALVSFPVVVLWVVIIPLMMSWLVGLLGTSAQMISVLLFTGAEFVVAGIASIESLLMKDDLKAYPLATALVRPFLWMQGPLARKVPCSASGIAPAAGRIVAVVMQRVMVLSGLALVCSVLTLIVHAVASVDMQGKAVVLPLAPMLAFPLFAFAIAAAAVMWARVLGQELLKIAQRISILAEASPQRSINVRLRVDRDLGLAVAVSLGLLVLLPIVIVAVLLGVAGEKS